MNSSELDALASWREELKSLGEKMLAAAEAGEWGQVSELDSRLATALQKLQRSPKLKELLADTLQLLQQQHQSVRQLCAVSRDELAKKMHEFNTHQDGLRAYEESQKWQ